MAGVAEHYDGDYTEYHDWKAGGGIAASQPIFEPRDHGVENLVDFAVATQPSGEQSKSASGKSKPSGKGKSAATKLPAIKVIKKKTRLCRLCGWKQRLRMPKEVERDL